MKILVCSKCIVSIKCHKRDLTTANFVFKLKSSAYYNSDTHRPYSQWLIPVNYWLINQCTDWAWTGVTPIGSHFDFNDVTYHIGIVTLTLDVVTSFLQLLYVQNVFQLMMHFYRL